MEYFAVVIKFPLISMASDPNFNQHEIDAKAKRANTNIRVLNVLFYSLVIACFLLGEYGYL